MRNLIKQHRLGVTLVLIGVLGMTLLAMPRVDAGHAGCSRVFYNRCLQHGYFTNQAYHTGGPGTYVMSTGTGTWGSVGGMPTNDVNSFVSRIHMLLHDGSPKDKYQDTTGAAFIVNTMLGRWGSDYGSRDAGVIYARNNFAEWEKRVRWYDSQGLVEWNSYYSYENFDNSLYDPATRDNSYYVKAKYEEQYTITFFAPNSNKQFRHFLIKKNCGNPIGTEMYLRPAPAPAPSEGTIQGYKVVNNDPNIQPPKGALITSTHKGGRSTRNNPYFFTDVPADNDGPNGPNRAFHRVTAEVPAGWRVGYNVCYANNAAANWRNPCGNNTAPITWNNSVVVDVYEGNPVNVWWHYERLDPPVTIKGRVLVWPNQVSGGGVGGVRIETCGAGVVSTNSSGHFSFTRPKGSAFCVRVAGGTKPANSKGPYIRPWSRGYPGQNPACPNGFAFDTSSPTVNGRNYCAQGSYECQAAGVVATACGRNWDRNWDEGYDFVFTVPPPPPNVNYQCRDGVVTATISWSTSARPATRYMVDVDDASSFSQFWNKGAPQGSSSTSAPAGFNPYPSGGPSLTLQRGQSYYVRVYYVNSNEHSLVRSAVAPTCWKFNVNSLSASVNLKPDDEAPTNADFASSFKVSYSPPGNPAPKGVKLSVTRSYYVLKADGVTKVNVNPGPNPNPDSRWFNGPDTNGESYSENRNLPPNTGPGDQVCITIRVSPGSGTVDGNGNVTFPTAALQTPPQCERIMAKPYFKVYNSDVLAGSRACPGWTASTSRGEITGYAYNDPTNAGKGSGTQLAAFAMDTILGFSSAHGRPAASPPAPSTGLTFANTASGWGGDFGGGFCPDDYAGAQPATNGLSSPVNLAEKNGDFSVSGTTRVRGNVNSGNRITLYVDGNVIIDDNITYGGSKWSVNSIPNFTLVASGNIYINSNVTEVAGVFIAQPSNWTDPNSAGGEIYTCAFGATPPNEGQMTSITGAPGNNNCRNQLTVNGAFIAKRVRLLRTHGSLKDSCVIEPREPVAPCAGSKMAERFIFSPEAWLSSSVNPLGNIDSYDSITNLPPIL